MKDEFVSFLVDNEDLLDVRVSKYLFQLISGQMTILNGSSFENQAQLINSFSSSLSISDTEFSDISVEESSLVLIGTSFSIDDVDIFNITHGNNYTSYFILCTLDSSLVMTDVSYTQADVGILTVLDSDAEIDQVEIRNVTSVKPTINISGR